MSLIFRAVKKILNGKENAALKKKQRVAGFLFWFLMQYWFGMFQINCVLPDGGKGDASERVLGTLIDRRAPIERSNVKGNYSFGD